MLMKTKEQLWAALAILLCLGSQQLHAQEYDKSLLKDYVLPDITRKSLDLEFGSTGNYIKATQDGFNDQKNRNISGDLSTIFNYKKITRKYIGKSAIGLDLSVSNTKTETSSKYEEGYFIPAFTYDHSSRFYKGNLFLEIEGTASLGLKNTFGDDSNQERNKNVGLLLPVSVGKGRIEEVTDMRQAMYVVHGLEKKGSLTQKISGEKLNELAQLMSRVKNKRFLDYRLHLQDEITAIDSFFVNNNYIESSNAKYFTTLYDYWLYGDRFERLSGMEFKGGLSPLYVGNWTKDEMLDRDYTQLGVQASVSFDYEEPLNLYWQQSVNAYIEGIYSTINDRFTLINHSNNTVRDGKKKTFEAKASYAIGFYPNTRTHLKVNIAETFGFIKSEDDETEQNQYNRAAITNLGLNAYYYLSPQLRLSATADLLYYKGSYAYSGHPSYSNKRWDAKYNIGFTYSFF